MSDATAKTSAIDATTKTSAIGAAVLAAFNIWFTSHVNTENQQLLERTKGELQVAIKSAEQRIEQTKAVTGIQNNTYLLRLPLLQKELETFVEFAERVADDPKAVRNIDRTVDSMRIKILFLAASCEPRPDDKQLAKAGDDLENAVELLRQSVIDGSVDEAFAGRSKGIISAWTVFQSEVFRAALRGYA